jgi:hypothetical protein
LQLLNPTVAFLLLILTIPQQPFANLSTNFGHQTSISVTREDRTAVADSDDLIHLLIPYLTFHRGYYLSRSAEVPIFTRWQPLWTLQLLHPLPPYTLLPPRDLEPWMTTTSHTLLASLLGFPNDQLPLPEVIIICARLQDRPGM